MSGFPWWHSAWESTFNASDTSLIPGLDRGWGGWMASPTRWTWVWVNSGSWWWTGRPGMLQFMGSQRVGHDWATELNWTGKLRRMCPKKGNAKEWSNYPTIGLMSRASKVMLKIIQARLQQYVNRELTDVQDGFWKGKGSGDQIANIW